MTTAIGSYATASALKARMAIADNTDDTVLGLICDQVNAYIEGPQACGRPICPMSFSTTTNGAILAGATSFVLTTVTGLYVGDALMLGSLTGTHENVIVSAINTGTKTVTPAAVVVNAYNSGDPAQRCYLFDGNGTPVLRYDKGIGTVSLVEIKWFTQDTNWHTVPATDYRMRPSQADRPLGFPTDRIEFVDIPLGGIGYFPPGYDTVRVTMTTGFPATPDDITEVALVAAARAWHAAQAGQQDIVGTDEMGRPLVSRYFSARDKETLASYSVTLPG